MSQQHQFLHANASSTHLRQAASSQTGSLPNMSTPSHGNRSAPGALYARPAMNQSTVSQANATNVDFRKHIWRSINEGCNTCLKDKIECVVEFKTGIVVMCQRCRERGHPAHKCRPSYDEQVCQRYKTRLSLGSFKYTPDGRLRANQKRIPSHHNLGARKPKNAAKKTDLKRRSSTQQASKRTVLQSTLRQSQGAIASAETTKKRLFAIALRAHDILNHTKKRKFVQVHAELILKACKDELKAIQKEASSSHQAFDADSVVSDEGSEEDDTSEAEESNDESSSDDDSNASDSGDSILSLSDDSLFASK